jgi:seryl-tRNA synthetase
MTQLLTDTMNPFSIKLDVPAHEMAQEEITKQVAFLSPRIRNVGFAEGGTVLRFDAPADGGAELLGQAKVLAGKVQRGLRSLKRKIVYRSKAADRPVFRDVDLSRGIHFLGRGQVALEGTPLRLFKYFDRIFEAFGNPWKPRPLLTPTLIPARTLARCDYFRSFPNNVTFAAHLHEDGDRIEDFRARHASREDLDDQALGDMTAPEACLSPAVCYHVYHLNENQVIPASGSVYGICGKCFRYESTNITDLRRLWDFTMREVVFLGGKDDVLAHRDRSMEMMGRLLEEHRLAGEIRTASDPFFIAPDAVAKTYFQLSSETKFEISLMLPDDARLAVGSHNYHTDFFGRAFNVTVDSGGFMHSVCVAFGLERWVHAFLVQHGGDVSKWPAVVRGAPEFNVPS